MGIEACATYFYGIDLPGDQLIEFDKNEDTYYALAKKYGLKLFVDGCHITAYYLKLLHLLKKSRKFLLQLNWLKLIQI